MKIKKVDLEIVIGVTSDIPETDKPEVAFAGKSNVGKSSLINTLMNRKSYARISSQPGKTQTVNFYNINDGMFLVDLPGYGYANANEEVKAKWGKMIEKYLVSSKQLRQVFLLVDGRHVPSENDVIMYDWIISNGFRPVIVATKMDKIAKTKVNDHIAQIRDGLGMYPEDILIPFSSATKQGYEELWNNINGVVPELLSAENLAAEKAGYVKLVTRSEEKLRRRSVDKDKFKNREKEKKAAKAADKPAAKKPAKPVADKPVGKAIDKKSAIATKSKTVRPAGKPATTKATAGKPAEKTTRPEGKPATTKATSGRPGTEKTTRPAGKPATSRSTDKSATKTARPTGKPTTTKTARPAGKPATSRPTKKK